jgi:hypothetical protein
MEQNWFEMPEVRRRKLATAVWIPLRAIHRIEEMGEYGHAGYKSEFYGVGTLGVPVEKKLEAERLGWTDVGIIHHHSGYVEDGKYTPADVYKDYDGKFSGLHLALEQRGNSAEHRVFHLHQDFVITMGLKREDDVWVRPDEGYDVVAKLSRREDESPYLIEVRASHLKDYLCARGMALYIVSYRNRVEIVEDAGQISWQENPMIQMQDKDRWEGCVTEIHEGGMPYGKKTAIFHVSRTDVDPEEDVPTLGIPTDNNVSTKSWTKEHTGQKLYLVKGELWRTEWIEPASKSPIVRRDKMPPTVFFITDAEGKQESSDTLVGEGRWLWFRPEVMMALAHKRGGSLRWHTRDTGRVGCSPDYTVHFGINSLGLVNVYAKDIALLPEWQQKIWAGYNVSPEGKVSEELLLSQVRAESAKTHAPEEFLAQGLARLNRVAHEKLGITLIRQHEHTAELLVRAHRFRATDKEGLFALAKDLARLTADSIDASAIQRLVSPPKDTKWGSLKSLEKLLATRIDAGEAHAMMSPLFGIYELRQADAHLPSQESNEALDLVRVDQSAPYVIQGYQLLHACVNTIYSIYDVIKSLTIEGNQLGES